MSSAMPGLTLAMAGPSLHTILPKIDANNPNDPELAYQKKLDFVDSMEIWERDSGPGDVNVGVFTNKMRDQLSKSKKASSTSGESLLTSKKTSKRKRIYGLGKTSDEKQTGTIKKPKLGGQ